jgi:hypothetical protein
MKRRVGLCVGAWLGALLAVGCAGSTSSPSPSATEPQIGKSPATPAMQMPTAAAPRAGDKPTSGGTVPTPTASKPTGGAPLAMGECGLDTDYDGDEYCILPPPPDQGFQLHIGPSNYDNPGA